MSEIDNIVNTIGTDLAAIEKHIDEFNKHFDANSKKQLLINLINVWHKQQIKKLS
ncbi:MAG: hypothetical protein ACMXYC_04125 [Candidatus Woesearchaeota archaeon]